MVRPGDEDELVLVERMAPDPRVAELPDGVWATEDYMDQDPSQSEGLIPIKVRMTIEGDQLSYDLSGSHPAVGSFMNAGFGTGFSGVVGGTKTFFPDVPLNSGSRMAFRWASTLLM